jgi:hypothetical protein
MSNIFTYQEFLNESEKQTKAGAEFEELIGGILKGTNIIQDVKYGEKTLTVIPNGKLGKIDVSLITGLLQDKSNVEKLKKMFKGIDSIKFEKMTIDIK